MTDDRPTEADTLRQMLRFHMGPRRAPPTASGEGRSRTRSTEEEGSPPVSTTTRPTPKHAATTALERIAAELAYLRNECHSIRHALDHRARERA